MSADDPEGAAAQILALVRPSGWGEAAGRGPRPPDLARSLATGAGSGRTGAGHSSAAYLLVRLEHSDAQAGLGEGDRGREAVGAGAYHNGVEGWGSHVGTLDRAPACRYARRHDCPNRFDHGILSQSGP